MTGESLTVTAADGRILHAAVAGPEDGELVVSHHGTPGGSTESYPPHVATAAERGMRLVVYARPGYGDSDRARGRTVADCAADTAAVADALGAERFFTIGGSGGGPHALACAALLSDRVIAAATIAGVAPYGAAGLDWLDGMGEENVQEFAAVEAGPEKLEAFIGGFRGELTKITADDVIQALGDLISEPDREALTGEYAAFAAASLREAVRTGIWGWFDDDIAILGDWGFDPAAIEVPVDVWQGEQDRMVPPAHGRWMAAHVGDARGHLLGDHGHLSLALGHFGEILDGLRARAQSR